MTDFVFRFTNLSIMAKFDVYKKLHPETMDLINHWLTLCTLNLHLINYLLTHLKRGHVFDSVFTYVFFQFKKTRSNVLKNFFPNVCHTEHVYEAPN